MASKTKPKPTTSTGCSRKMVPVVCYKCKNTVDIKCTLICSMCTNRYEFECAGYSEKIYNLSSEESKKKWKCKSCISTKKDDKLRVSSGPSKVTLRKAQTQNLNKNETSTGTSTTTTNTVRVSSSPQEHFLNIECHSKEDSLSTLRNEPYDSLILDTNALSGYDISGSSDEPLSPSCMLSKSADGDIHGLVPHAKQNHELHEKISTLETTLLSTENELGNKIIENNELHRKIQQLSIEIKVLQSLCFSSASDSNNICTTRKKRRSSLIIDASSTPTSSVNVLHGNKELASDKNLLNLQLKIIDMEKMLRNIEREIVTLGKQMESLGQSLQMTDNKCTPITTAVKPMGASPTRAIHQISDSLTKVTPTLLCSKLCVISNHSNHMLKLIKRDFTSGNTCLYLTPGAGTRELFAGLPDKLQDFSLNDFCIIYIGDKDFKTTANYYNLVKYIEEQLSLVQHTNIVICSPTFKINGISNFFNTRVEIFNSLLVKNNLKHELCYILDSNLNLSYDSYMFSRFGNVNKQGFITIYNDLVKLLTLFPFDCKMTQTDENKTNIMETHVNNNNDNFLDLIQEQEFLTH